MTGLEEFVCEPAPGPATGDRCLTKGSFVLTLRCWLLSTPVNLVKQIQYSSLNLIFFFIFLTLLFYFFSFETGLVGLGLPLPLD